MAYKAIRKKRGVAFSIVFLINFTLYRFFKGFRLPGGYAWPFIAEIQLEPTKLCDMKCPMCTNPYLTNTEKGNMSYDNFVKVMKQFPFLRSIKIQDVGLVAYPTPRPEAVAAKSTGDASVFGGG